MSSFSSLRLDNYVYTVEGGFQNAKAVLADQGSLVLTFFTGRNFATDRLYATLGTAFGIPAAAYFTGYGVNGILLVEGQARRTKIEQLADASADLQSRTSGRTLVAPLIVGPSFYLTKRSIPDSILATGGLFSSDLLVRTAKNQSHCLEKQSRASSFFFFGGRLFVTRN